jgi:hypothetical protein
LAQAAAQVSKTQDIDAWEVWCEFPSAHGMKIRLIDSILIYARQT